MLRPLCQPSDLCASPSCPPGGLSAIAVQERMYGLSAVLLAFVDCIHDNVSAHVRVRSSAEDSLYASLSTGRCWENTLVIGCALSLQAPSTAKLRPEKYLNVSYKFRRKCVMKRTSYF